MPDTRLHRRQFLATGVGLATSAVAATRAAQAVNDRIGIGLVGCGNRGTYLLNQALAAAPGQIQLVALCDVWSEARQKLAA